MEIIKNTEKYTTEHVNILGELEDILEKIKDERAFQVIIDERENKILIIEKCDEYFGVHLDSNECRKLSKVFDKLANHLDNKGESNE